MITYTILFLNKNYLINNTIKKNIIKNNTSLKYI